MGDGTDYYSSDVSGGGEDDGTSSSIASVYSVEPSNSVNDDMYLSTPLMSNMKEEVGMDLPMNSNQLLSKLSSFLYPKVKRPSSLQFVFDCHYLMHLDKTIFKNPPLVTKGIDTGKMRCFKECICLW